MTAIGFPKRTQQSGIIEPKLGTLRILQTACLALLAIWITPAVDGRQERAPLVVRPGPPPLDDLETDSDRDGIPDGWYNLRDAKTAPGGVVGPTCFEFKNGRPGRPARASRAFGVDGRSSAAIIIGLWIKIEAIARGERVGEEPQLVITFLDESLRPRRHGNLGPWLPPAVPRGEWVRVAKRIEVPPEGRDALLTVGLLGATGTLQVDGLTIDSIPAEPVSTTNLVLNGDLELGDPSPAFWNVKNGACRVFPGRDSSSGLELSRSGDQAQLPLAVPVSRLTDLHVRCDARGSGLRASGGASAAIYFLDAAGRVLPGTLGGQRLFRFEGTFPWQAFDASVRVPSGAQRAVIQIDKSDNLGSLTCDNLVVTALPDPSRARWTPGHNALDTSGWHPYEPAAAIEPGSALDASYLLDPPADSRGFVAVKAGRLWFENGPRARFFGAVLLPPLAVAEPDVADALADNLARRGINLARFADLDVPLGPGRSLIDDTADHTRQLDPLALARFDHLVAALRKRGISIALDLNSARRVRAGDDVPGGPALPPGGGPAAAFEPSYSALVARFARDLLDHVNPETGLALKDNPALAWVAISGEASLFDLIDDPDALPGPIESQLRELAQSRSASGRRLWQTLESDHWRSMSVQLRSAGLKVPIAGCSHWRREPEFCAAQAATGLDLIDDRLFLPPQPYALADRRGLRFSVDGGLAAVAAPKRRADRPYVVSHWCSRTGGLWAMPDEPTDLLLAADQAAAEDWDALVRRGVFFEPGVWGTAPPGTRGGSDVYAVPEALNANPALFAILPHASSLFLRGGRAETKGQSRPASSSRAIVDSDSGRALIQNSYTYALAVLDDRRPSVFGDLTLEVETPGAVVAVSSAGPEPLARAGRLLVTAVGRVEPSGQTYMDACLASPASPGGPPLLLEPVSARITWKQARRLEAYALDPSGRRLASVPLEETPSGAQLRLTGRLPGPHWEIVAASASETK
jgi:hypothetical protein